MGNVVQFPQESRDNNRKWNQGYHDGYNRRAFDEDETDSIVYTSAYNVGISDRIEDDKAMESGTFDFLNEEERQWIYGDESP